MHSILAARAGDLLLLDLSVPFSQNSSLNLQKNSKLQGTAKVDTHATLESLAFSFRTLLRRVLERMALEQSLQKIARERERERDLPYFPPAKAAVWVKLVILRVESLIKTEETRRATEVSTVSKSTLDIVIIGKGGQVS